MNEPRFDGFYFSGQYFEAAWDDRSVSWACHKGCDGRLEIPMARLWSHKLGTLKIMCPVCQCPWQMELTTLANPIKGDITELSDQPAQTSSGSSDNWLFPS